MNSYYKTAMTTTVLSAALLMTACSSTSRNSPKQVAENNPTVTYEYKNDEDLIEANQLSATYCAKYGSVPIVSKFDTDRRGDKTVNFECVPKTPQTYPLPVNNLTYTYRTDQELMSAARNAQIYCANNGNRQAFSNITTNPDGSRTVVFQCSM